MLRKYHLNTLTKAFDKWSNTYTSDVEPKLTSRGYGYDQLAELVAGVGEADQVLEVGTGTGLLGRRVRALLPATSSLGGVDISSGMLRNAASTGAYDVLVRSNAEDLPFPDHTFSVVFSAFMIHSAPNVTAAAREFHRVVRPGGSVVLVDLFRSGRRIPVLTRLVDTAHSIRHEHGALSSYVSPGEMLDVLDTCGFSEIRYERLGERRRYTHVSFLTRSATCEPATAQPMLIRCGGCTAPCDPAAAEHALRCTECGASYSDEHGYYDLYELSS